MTLSDFLNQTAYPRSANVEEFGFSTLYVRYGPTRVGPALTIARVVARIPGEGLFTKLLEKIQNEHPELWIRVESVQTPQFQAGLVRRGFKLEDVHTYPPSYLLEPKLEKALLARSRRGTH